MSTIYKIKPAFQSILRPLSNYLASKGVTANQVTLGALALSATAGIGLVLFSNSTALLLLPIVLFIRMALNAIDGMLAREHNMISKKGALLNELGDVLSDTFLFLPLAFYSDFHPGLVIAFVLLAVISEFTGVVSTQIGNSRKYDGPMGKSDRAFHISAIASVLGLGASGGTWLLIAQILLILLSLFTIKNRFFSALAEE